MTDWILPLLAALILFGVMMWLNSSKQVSTADARAYLKNGAVMLDVRSPGEYGARHLPVAKNVPLDELEKLAPRMFNDQKQVLLLHCQSGMRSRVAQRKLRAMGYANAFNMGSYGRAQEIVNGS